MKITSRTLRDMQRDAIKALKEVEDKYAVEFSFHGGNYSPDNATLNLQISTVNKSGEVQSREFTDYKRYSKSKGLKVEWLGKKFTARGKTFKLLGFKSRNHRYPIIVENMATGGRVKVSIEFLKANMI